MEKIEERGIVTRFAPSPTGGLHVGNIRTALMTWLYAKKMGGKFILRIDDTDRIRSKEIYVKKIQDVLNWLGLNYDDIFFQSKRVEKYNTVIKDLLKSKRFYKCYETKEELYLKRKLLLSRGKPPIYDRSSLNLTEKEKERYSRYHIRFFLKDNTITFEDHVRGKQSFEAKNISDPILVREDGTITYSIASVYDDMEYGITDIIRGEDHLSNSAVHVQLFEAMAAPFIPRFAHLPLLKMKEGNVLSKRSNDSVADVENLRKKHRISSLALINYLAKLGTNVGFGKIDSIDALVENFEFKNLGKAAVIYDFTQLRGMNTLYLRGLSAAQVGKLININKVDSRWWEIVRNNIFEAEDLEFWYNKLCSDEAYTVSSELKPFVEIMRNIKLSDYSTWIKDISSKSGFTGKKLYKYVRLCITGMEDGPSISEMFSVLHPRLQKRLDNINFV